MKRNNDTKKVAHLKARNSESRYAAKLARGRQMYGPGCCANKVTDEQVRKTRLRAIAEGHRISSWDGEVAA